MHIDLDWLSRYLVEETVKPVSPRDSQVQFSVGSEWFSVRSAFESLRYLLANEIKAINRPFARRPPLPPGGHWVWSGYSREDEVRSVAHILGSCLEEYAAFVEGNRLRFPSSPYLDTETSIVLEYEPVGIADFRGSLLREYHIRESQGSLPKLSVFVKTGENQSSVTSKGLLVTVRGVQYKAVLSRTRDATFFFQRTPVLDLIYEMLVNDLSKHYDLDMIGILP